MEKEQKIALIKSGAAAVLLAAVWLSPAEGPLRLVLFLVPYLLAGYEIIIDAFKDLFHGEVFNENMLMTVATVGALILGEYPEAVAVMLLNGIGEFFEDLATDKSRKSIAELMNIRPDRATVVRGGEETEVAPPDVKIGETVVVKPGEKIPLDGVVIEGESTVDFSALTGESLPKDITVGENAVSGTVNLTSVIKLRVTAGYGESTVSKILDLVENAQERKAKTENFVSRFAKYYTPCVLAVAVLLAVLPPLLFPAEAFADWISRALIFLVVSCPCALVVSVPLTFFAAIGGASRRGILIKGSSYIEALSKADVFVFDKTGTLTRGVFCVTDVHPSDMDEAELLDIAALAESYSDHPIAQSIVAAHSGHIDKSRITSIKEHAGLGIEAVIDGRNVYAGNGKLMDKIGVEWQKCECVGTIVHIADGKRYCGHIVIADEIKPGSKEALQSLKAAGIRQTVMLTGDNEEVGADVAGKIGVDGVRAGLLPKDKVDAVEELLKNEGKGKKLVFVGDGINDAPVIARADLGVAMGAMGADSAIEAADVVLMDDDPKKLSEALHISRKTMRIARENIIFALSVKAAVLILSAFGVTDMWIAVFADVGVSCLAVLNSLRAMKKPKNV